MKYNYEEKAKEIKEYVDNERRRCDEWLECPHCHDDFEIVLLSDKSTITKEECSIVFGCGMCYEEFTLHIHKDGGILFLGWR